MFMICRSFFFTVLLLILVFFGAGIGHAQSHQTEISVVESESLPVLQQKHEQPDSESSEFKLQNINSSERSLALSAQNSELHRAKRNPDFPPPTPGEKFRLATVNAFHP